jgi:hypothetical protein
MMEVVSVSKELIFDISTHRMEGQDALCSSNSTR